MAAALETQVADDAVTTPHGGQVDDGCVCLFSFARVSCVCVRAPCARLAPASRGPRPVGRGDCTRHSRADWEAGVLRAGGLGERAQGRGVGQWAGARRSAR